METGINHEISERLSTQIKRAGIFLFISLNFINITSCVISRPPFPRDWSPRIKNASVQSFSGEYHPAFMKIISRDSLGLFDDLNCTALFQIDDDLGFTINPQCTDYSDNNVSVYRKSNDDWLISGDLNARRISVRRKNKGILMRYHSSVAGNPLAGFSKEYILLSRSNDGSLIIRDGYWAYGVVFFIIPIGINRYIWYRIRNDSAETVK